MSYKQLRFAQPCAAITEVAEYKRNAKQEQNRIGKSSKTRFPCFPCIACFRFSSDVSRLLCGVTRGELSGNSSCF